MRSRHTTALAALGAVCAVLVTGCAGGGVPVLVPSPAPTGAGAYACAAFKGRLPFELLGQTTTPTKPSSTLVDAWGSPAIVVRCGVPPPAALTPTSQLVTVDGVDWLPEQLEHGYLFTTVGRALNVEASVPDAYAPESDALVELAPVVRETIPVSGSATPSPSG